MEKFISCENCEQGYIYSDEGVKSCKCRLEWQKKELFENDLKKSGIPSKIENYDISMYIGKDEFDNIPKLKKYVKEFSIRFNSINLYFWSKINSTQKTTVAQWIGKELLKRRKSVSFMLMDNLIQLLMNGYMDKDNSREKIADLLEKDFIIIDDSFDKAKVNIYHSKYQISFLDNFLRTRMENLEKATCFTSNLSIDEVGEIWGRSLKKLLERNIITPMEFNDNREGKNYVIKANKDFDIWSD